MKLTRKELVHGQDRQLVALGVKRTGNSGWLQRALKMDFTEQQVKLFHSLRKARKASIKPSPTRTYFTIRVEAEGADWTASVESMGLTAVAKGEAHLGAHEVLTDIVHQITKHLYAERPKETAEETEATLKQFVEAGTKAWANVPDAAAWVRELRGEEPEDFANELFEKNGRDLA